MPKLGSVCAMEVAYLPKSSELPTCFKVAGCRLASKSRGAYSLLSSGSTEGYSESEDKEWVDGIRALPSLQKGARWADEDEDEEPASSAAHSMHRVNEPESTTEDDDDIILFDDVDEGKGIWSWLCSDETRDEPDNDPSEHGMCRSEKKPAVTFADVQPDFYIYIYMKHASLLALQQYFLQKHVFM